MSNMWGRQSMAPAGCFPDGDEIISTSKAVDSPKSIPPITLSDEDMYVTTPLLSSMFGAAMLSSTADPTRRPAARSGSESVNRKRRRNSMNKCSFVPPQPKLCKRVASPSSDSPCTTADDYSCSVNSEEEDTMKIIQEALTYPALSSAATVLLKSMNMMRTSNNMGMPLSIAGDLPLKEGRQSESSTHSRKKARRSFKYVQAVGGKPETKPPPTSPDFTLDSTSRSPQEFLEDTLRERGYSTKKHSSLNTGYNAKPTPLQQASFGTEVVKAVRRSDVPLLSSLLSCGLSPNPCNSFGDSIVDMVCKRGQYDMLRCMVDNGCTVQVADGFGRTPLHHAAWAAEPCFRSVELILQQDLCLILVADKQGKTPLQYVRRANWSKWIDFLNRKKTVYWPLNKREKENPPAKLHRIRNAGCVSIPDPDNALSIELAKMVSSGSLTPEKLARENLLGQPPTAQVPLTGSYLSASCIVTK